MSAFAKFGWLATVAGIVLAAAGSGCTTEAFCWRDCDGGATGTGTGTGTGGSGGTGGCLFGCTGGGGQGGSGGDAGSGGCKPTNDGSEICDKLDNDCNGKVDDLTDWSTPKGCGTCDNNCYELLLNNDPDSITCTPSAEPGTTPGVCNGQCAADYFDLDSDKVCEYYCVKDPAVSDDSSCNNKDDDCDGVKDEDVDLCTSTKDCGKCGGTCVVLHGTPECVHTGPDACSPQNTQCQIQACEPGFYDLDKSYATGCEYQCNITNGGVEICGDSVDNDCDGKIDDADEDLSGDPQLGKDCFADPDGECATPAHLGKTICAGNKVVCSGPNILVENQQPELCNTKDDDCDGVVDDSPTDAGKACGASANFPCTLGTQQCMNGALVCVGNIDPKTETCDGEDNDCDGMIDKTGNNPPADSVGACDVPKPPPAGATSPCKGGTKACVGGAITCQGSVKPAPGAVDGCNIDANCDGVLTNQPDKQSDVNNCGACGNSCYKNAVHSTWACVNGGCAFQGCEPGYYDLNNDKQCEYACVFVQAQEACNGVDDDCDGMIDEGVVAPSPVQVCGVSPSANSTECTSGVTVACQQGVWKCTFPNSVCAGGCDATDEVCDNFDNDCDGLKNENVANWNKPCASDEGLAPPGHGACRTNGVYVCSSNTATMCNAVPANCNSLPGGCTEVCDGVDNDCDGIADEAFNNKGSNSANFVKPTVTKLGSAAKWIFSYEASRPSATGVIPGTGNGFWTSAPAGATIDKTPACSVPGKIPWFNVTPREVEQVCASMGGTVCTQADWQAAARLPAPDACTYGYAPLGAACKSGFVVGTKFCNIGPSYDFDTANTGDQDGLLPTGSALLKNCWADWTGQTNNKIFDITGNLREITKVAVATKQYPLMGGAFNTQAEGGAANNFSFYTVDENFQFFDTGFRCCFASDPTL
ncbi:MopE-related protein [Polyangium aurulentum]|uniref:MopE-related protein n=1 Tax=Polyangium aurulentum TaxID=2567896 RepID=UPI00200C5BB0|nr:MopE-related protein [Polyangium aurulentum]UQA54940.1 hypothetical protein E8A73_026645 [Polyangium aurulentum]